VPDPDRAVPEQQHARPEQQAWSDTQHKSPTTIAEIVLADEPGSWAACGFAVRGEEMWLGDVRVVLAGREAGRGIVGWSVRGIAHTALDGLPTTICSASPPTTAESLKDELRHIHPNGVQAIDHVVAMSPNLDRGIEALQAAGLDLRRIRERPTPAGAPRQAFFRLGAVILELVQEPAQVVQGRPEGSNGPARFWGLALLTDDIEHTARAFSEHCGEIRPAVQYGRRIATVKRSAGLSLPVALMSPAVE